MLVSVRGLYAGLALCALALGCEAQQTTLIVQVRTDLAPGRDFAEVRVSPDFASPIHTAAGAGREWGSGVRVAELAGLGSDEASLEVAALDAAGAVVVSRPVRVRLEGGVQVVTVLLTRACGGVVCPSAGDPPDAVACVAGRCVAEECVVEREESCGTAECAGDAECGGGSACATARCVAGACFLAPDHAACAADEVCDAALGCATLDGFSPRGPGHAILKVDWDDGDARIVRVRLDGSGHVDDVSAHLGAALGRPPTLQDYTADASPNGRWLVVVDAEHSLARVDLDGVVATQYVLRGTIYAEPVGAVITDDGATILHIATPPDGGWGIFEVTDEGGGRFVASGVDRTAASPFRYLLHPRIAGPDLVFLGSSTGAQGDAICRLDGATGEVDTLYEVPMPGMTTALGLAVEATGDLLVNVTNPGVSTSRIYRVPAAGGSATPASEYGELDQTCALPDGRYLAVHRGPPATLRILRAGAAEEEHVITDWLRPGVSSAFLTDCAP